MMCGTQLFIVHYILKLHNVEGDEYTFKMRRKKMGVVPPIGMEITFGKFTAVVKSISAPISFDVITCTLVSDSPCNIDDSKELQKMGWILESYFWFK